MRTRLGWHGRLAVAGAVLTTLVVAAPAGAATTVKLAGGTTTLRLDARTARALHGLGISVAPATPAKRRGGGIQLAITRGTIDPATAKGTIDHSGGLTLRAGHTKVTLKSLSLNTSKRTVTAKVGRRTLAVGSLDLGHAHVSRDGFATTLAGVKVKLSRKGAAALDRAFGTRAIRGGVTLGTATIAATPAQIAITSGTTTLAVNAQTQGGLQQLRVSLAPVAPATVGATGIGFPVTGGTIDVRTFAGTIQASGGLALTQGSTPIQLMTPTVTFSATPQLAVAVGGAPITIADLDLSAATRSVDPSTRTISVSGASVKLTATAAGTLNQLFRGGAFRAGAEIATASLTAQAR
jgi:hypothetical protein